MEEYTKLVTEISGKLWKEFKPRISQDMTKDEFWTDAHDTIVKIVDEYKGTVAEGYAIDMAVFYFLQLQRIYFKSIDRGKLVDYTDMLADIAKAMKNTPNFDFNGFFDSRQ